MAVTYVEFPGGTREPDGYIVPCEVIREIPGWVQVRLTAAPPNHMHHWKQWVRKSQLLTEEQVTES